MQKELGTTGALIGMTVLSALFIGLALAIFPGWAPIGNWIKSSGDVPAWIQAIGSIAAIVAATVIASRQSRQAHRQELERYRQRMDALSGIFQRAWSLVSEILENTDDPNNAYYYVTEHHSVRDVEDVMRELEKVDITGLGSAEAVAALLDLRSGLRKARGIVDSIGTMDHQQLEDIEWDELRSAGKKILSSANASRQLLLRLSRPL